MKKLFRIFNWLRLLYAITGTISGLTLRVVVDYLSDSGNLASMKYLIPAFIVCLITILIVEINRKRLINVTLKATTSRTEVEKERSAKKGLITFVSLYNPLKSSSADKLSVDEREKAAINKDYRFLDLENSNLQPVIEAICSHKSSLQHCWLIGTTNTEKAKGSIMYQDVLIEFLKKEKGINYYIPPAIAPLSTSLGVA